MQAALAHQSVLLKEAVDALNVYSDGAYMDGTFGGGGHAKAILDSLNFQGQLLAIDRDPVAERIARTQFGDDPRFTFERDLFSHLEKVADSHQLKGRIQGILLDIGVSSPQLDDAQRGFSFDREGPLDMRMDPTTGNSAAQWLASVDEVTLARVLKEFGEERFYRRIAKAIIATRRKTPIVTTRQLAQLIDSVVPFREPYKHPATRSFQAIRILINRELEELESALAQSIRVLAPGGRLVVICFHSLEDRLVKRFMRRQAHGLELPLDLPVTASQSGATLRVIGKSRRPDRIETQKNPRARSAVMRVAERLA